MLIESKIEAHRHPNFGPEKTNQFKFLKENALVTLPGDPPPEDEKDDEDEEKDDAAVSGTSAPPSDAGTK